MAELRKLRRQFISYTKTHPTQNPAHVSNMFEELKEELGSSVDQEKATKYSWGPAWSHQ
ncbi:Protein KTI12 -like protein [Takifugu flavidus]|uniref:Protein KTI12-like protein n=1 Tax=Takifugu flavidus TaxID=433684 RepID=A0A5C6PBE9_9TELE|nr:Protein KTI12 -like protein [Takifugu flavidus]